MNKSISNPPDLKKSRRQRGDYAANFNRLPPHDLQMEMGVIGCQLLDPNVCIGEVMDAFKGDDKFYYDLRHQTIQKTLFAMFSAQKPVDLITLQNELKTAGMLEQIGGIPYLSQLQDIPSAANLSYYLEKVQEKYTLRRMIQACSGVVGRIYDYEGDVEMLMDEVEKEILSIAESRETNEVPEIKTLVNQSLITIEKMHNQKGELSGIGSGFSDLDKMTDGFHGGEMIVVAARPSMGKTSIGMQIAEHIAVELKLPVGVFSLEMSAASLVLRMIASLARVNLRTIRDGFMSEADFPRLSSAAGKLSASKLFIDDTSGLSILQLRARARRMHQQHGIKLFVIDYLQLLNAAGKRAEENRQQEIADISCGIKGLAKELNVPVIVLAQLNREIEKDKSRKPRMADLRESGQIEADADIIGLLYKPDRNKEDESEEESEACAVNLLIAKQRNGPTGDCCLTFLKPYTRFESAAKFSDDVETRHPHAD